MGPSVYVKVVGFRDGERHALNTLFRLSTGRSTSYRLWTPEAPVAPHLAMIDLEACAGNLAPTLRSLNSNLKMICVGHGAPANAWHTFQRPLHWPAVVKVMDSLFDASGKLGAEIDFGEHDLAPETPPTPRVSLLVDPSREDRLYLRARLALAGLTEVDESPTGAQALELAKNRPYDLVIAGLELPDMEGWVLVREFMRLEPAIGSVVVTSTDKSRPVREQAQASGCRDLLEKPYDPLKVVELLKPYSYGALGGT